MYQARQLVAQRNILGDEIGTVLENSCCDGENRGELERHRPNHSLSPNEQKNSAKSRSYRIMTIHNVERENAVYPGEGLTLFPLAP